MTENPTLEELLTEALTSADTENELARRVVDSGALELILRRGTLDEKGVMKRLGFNSEAVLRSVTSKARRGKSSFPVPMLDERRWARSAVDEYRKARRRRSASSETQPEAPASDSTGTASTAPNTPDSPIGGNASTGVSTPITSTTSVADTAPNGSFGGSGDSGTVRGGAGDDTTTGDRHTGPDHRHIHSDTWR